jgi:CubicO group peptidase (beta-lactamase class C family)/peptidoglycan/LPS O-acetylase OafA/YrhL
MTARPTDEPKAREAREDCQTAAVEPPGGRDGALDLLRGVALVRVVAWHTFAATWLTWFAAIPVMFFVAGALLVPSLARHGYRDMLRRRVARLLIPLWFYGALVGAVGAVQARLAGAPVEIDTIVVARALSWLVPIVDPAPGDWHGGWLSNHLWYLRAYLWVLLATPVLVRLARRPIVALAGVTVVVCAVELAPAALGHSIRGTAARMLVEDFLVYGSFAVLGMAYRMRAPTLRPLPLAVGAATAAVAGAAHATAIRLPEADVNASHGATVLTGMAWLLLAGACERPLRKLATRRTVRTVTAAVSRRALTVYLWHPAAIVMSHGLVNGNRPAPAVTLSLLVPTATACLVAAAGFLEDVAGRRRPLLPRAVRGALVAPATIAFLAVATPVVIAPLVGTGPVGATTVADAPLRPPSFREPLAASEFATRRSDEPTPIALPHGRLPARRLQLALDAWRRAHPEIEAVSVAVAVDGKTWSGSSVRRGSEPMSPDERIATLSLTKLFTVALTLRAVDAGLVELDDPAPHVSGVSFPPDLPPITVRQLLTHTSGLLDYREAPGYEDVDVADLTPQRALELAVRAPLRSPPGSELHYSSANYLWVGLVLEDVTSRPFAQLVADLVRPLGLSGIRVGPPPSPGWVGHAAGGIYATQVELAQWLEALFTAGRVLPPHRVAQLRTLGPHNIGVVGTWPLCPCWTGGAGPRRASGYGHHVGYGGLYYDPGGAAVSIRLRPHDDRTGDHVKSLQRLLVGVLRR